MQISRHDPVTQVGAARICITYVGELGWELYVPVEFAVEMGRIKAPPANRSAAARAGGSGAYRPNGVREPALGLPSNSGRVDEVWPHGVGNGDPVGFNNHVELAREPSRPVP